MKAVNLFCSQTKASAGLGTPVQAVEMESVKFFGYQAKVSAELEPLVVVEEMVLATFFGSVELGLLGEVVMTPTTGGH